MSGRIFKRTCVEFFFLLLATFDGFRLVLMHTQSLQNVTQFLSQSTSVVIQCTSNFMNSAGQISWYMYMPQKTIIYNALTPSNINSNKYVIGTGDNITLTVMNVQLTDALTYCCTVNGLDDYCSNVVLIDSLISTVYPSNGVSVGDSVNLTCLLNYNAPSRDIVSPMPLSDDQEPNLSMMIGKTQITSDLTGEQVVGTTTVPHSITLSYNRTAYATDAGMNLTCVVSSTYPPLSNQRNTPINVFTAPTRADIKYPNGIKSHDNIYPIKSVFTCVGDGYPIPTVDWLDGNMNSLNLQSSTGSTTWMATKEATYNLSCVAWNALSAYKIYNTTRFIVRNNSFDYTGETTAAKPSGLAEEIIIGIGVGVGVGGILVLGAILFVVLCRRSQRIKKTKTDGDKTKRMEDNSEGGRSHANNSVVQKYEALKILSPQVVNYDELATSTNVDVTDQDTYNVYESCDYTLETSDPREQPTSDEYDSIIATGVNIYDELTISTNVDVTDQDTYNVHKSCGSTFEASDPKEQSPSDEYDSIIAASTDMNDYDELTTSTNVDFTDQDTYI